MSEGGQVFPRAKSEGGQVFPLAYGQRQKARPDPMHLRPDPMHLKVMDIKPTFEFSYEIMELML